MRVITRKRLREFAERYPDAAEPLGKWESVVREAGWTSLQDVRRVFPHADAAIVASENTVTVFNIGGNKYRLITAIHYNTQRIFVLRLLTHAAYSKDLWKDTL
ncbi:MAG: type II toxin-antitoxin system HigB family toxin [Planctomycetes bacterium]|nr:type II toxin-antitoxin system HigB family toxin [Planctomycetota bacterium]